MSEALDRIKSVGKARIQEAEVRLAEAKELVEVMEMAGQPTTTQRDQVTQLEAEIRRWKLALGMEV